MRVPPDIQNCANFIGHRQSDGTQVWGGTAFLLGILLDETTVNHAIYCVTAKHNLIHLDGTPRNEVINIRVNLRNGGSYALNSKFSDWERHPTEDIAVLAWPTLWDTEDGVNDLIVGAFISDVMCRNADDLRNHVPNLGEGDEVFIAGLFRRHIGRSRNVPVIRIGNIAMMPGEPVPSRIGDIEGAYLVEVRSIGGLSGSPVFVAFEHPRVRPKTLLFYLIGMIHGHWDIPAEAFTDYTDANEQINMGMAIVIPINKVLDFIRDHPSFKS